MDEQLIDTNCEELDVQQTVAYNLGDLKKEEDILLNLYTKMKDQLHKLEVEELELKQKIRRKELKETTAELFPPPPPPVFEPMTNRRKRQTSKGKSRRRKKQERTSSISQDEGTSEFDDAMSVTSSLSQPSPVSIRSVKSTPTRKSNKESSGQFKAVRALTIPSADPEKLNVELDLSALNALPLQMEFSQSNVDFIESEDEH